MYYKGSKAAIVVYDITVQVLFKIIIYIFLYSHINLSEGHF